MRNVILILAIVFLFSCNNENKTPEYVIPEDDMVEIIIDMHLTDGLFTVSKVRRELTRADSLNYYDEIFRNYGYSRAEFDTSIFYYSKNINKYDRIYQEVLNTLNEMDTEVRQERDKKREDDDYDE